MRLQANNSDSPPRTSTVMPIVYCTRITSQLKRLSTGWSLRSTESTFTRSARSVDTDRGLSIDKKSKFSRKRNNDDEGDITYINERNRVFNKKVSRSKRSKEFLCSQVLVAARSRGTTTSTQRRSVRASSVEPHCDGRVLFCYRFGYTWYPARCIIYLTCTTLTSV